jgi:Ca-activated chloride channel family protein
MLDTLPLLADDEVCRIRGLDDPGKVDPDAGFGSLTTERGALPLVALAVRARLDGLIAHVEVRQSFVNTHEEPLEATYIFPLPDRAAVSRFRLEVAGRIVEGELQERNQARQTYDRAIQAGHRAAIAEEERPGVFTLRVGNLPPGERADVTLEMVGPMPFSDGEVTFRFPLVVAPRYVPGSALGGPAVGAGIAPDTDAVPDASRISPPVLLPGFKNPVRLSLVVDVPASPLAPHSFRSSLHTVTETQHGNARRFRVQPGERLDRDFILRYRLGDDRLHTALCVQPDRDGEEGTFLLTLVPPRPRGDARPAPRDVVFILDRSGSMSGWKMVAARRAVARMVETLTEEDRFTIYAFDDSIETPPGFDGVALVPASDRQRWRAAEFLRGIDARGGTEMAEPLDKAVEELARHAAGGQRILVLITDGQVANEDQILRRIGAKAKGMRIFTLGIDRAVNAGFLRRLADLGGGAGEVVESQERLDEVMDQVHRHIGTPVLTGLELRPAGLEVIAKSLVPGRLPDLFAGAPVVVAGRYRGKAGGTVVVRAKDEHGEGWAMEVPAWVDADAPLGRVWARGRVRELEDRYVIGGHDRAKLENEIVSLSLGFGVLSRFTAFVAVDKSAVVNPGGEQKQVTQAVEPPAGWGRVDQLAASIPPAAAGARTLCGGFDLAMARAEAAPRAPAPAGPPRKKAKSPPPLMARAEDFSGAVDLGDEDLDDEDDRPQRHFRGIGPVETRMEGHGSGGVLSRLLSMFTRRSRKQPATPPIDRTAFRPRVEDLLRRLRDGVADETAARLAALKAVAADLETLFEELVRAGDRDESVERLGKLLVSLRPLLAEMQPLPTAVEDHHRRIVAALEAWLLLAPVSAGREGFWK